MLRGSVTIYADCGNEQIFIHRFENKSFKVSGFSISDIKKAIQRVDDTLLLWTCIKGVAKSTPVVELSSDYCEVLF